MYTRFWFTAVTAGFIAGSASAQTFQQRAVFTGGGNRDEGQCVIEVVVDGAAEVEVRGDTALLRNLSGQPPQWRRFECTSVMPQNPVDFRFAGVDGLKIPPVVPKGILSGSPGGLTGTLLVKSMDRTIANACNPTKMSITTKGIDSIGAIIGGRSFSSVSETI